MKQCLFVLMFIPSVLLSQNKLKTAKENISKNSKNNVRQSSSKKSNDKDEIEYSGLTHFFAQIVYRVTLGILVGDLEERDLNPYPYYYDDEGEYAKFLSKTGRKQSLKLGMNYVSNTVNSFDFNALYKPIPIIGFNMVHIHLSEKNATEKTTLDMTSLGMNFYRIREKNISLWWGAGATYVSNEVNKLGIYYNLGVDVYPIKPISLHVSWQESFVNESQIILFKSQLKYHIKNKMLFIGYHAYQIANQEIRGPALGFEVVF